MTDDPYEILGVDRSADSDTIKKAYRKRAKEYHPDVNKGDAEAEEMFKKISQAYEVLSDSNKRAQFDRFGSMDFDQDRFGFDPFDGGGIRIDDLGLFGDFFNLNQGMRGGMNFGGPRPRQQVAPDIRFPIRISLRDVIGGTKIKVGLPRQMACEKCNGTGHGGSGHVCSACSGVGKIRRSNGNMTIIQTCPACHGAGHEFEKCGACGGRGGSEKAEELVVKIPAGIPPMSHLKIKGKGNVIFVNDKLVTGDAYGIIDFNLEENGVVYNKGTLHTSIDVPIQAILKNEEIGVDILGRKKLKLKLDANKASGTTYEIKKGGASEDNSAFVKVFYSLPKKNISEEDRKRLAELLEEIYGRTDKLFTPRATNG